MLRVWARWVPDLGGFRFYCFTRTSGFSATERCGGKAVPSGTWCHAAYFLEARSGAFKKIYGGYGGY